MKSHSASKALPLDYIVHHARTLVKEDIRDEIVGDIYRASATICKDSVQYTDKNKLYRSEKLDKIFTSPIFGFPIMLAILSVVFYLTIAGANVPSDMIAEFFGWAEGHLTTWFQTMNAPKWLHGILILGLFRGTGAVISVMLPPMAIFFPIFALLENYGYLPRVAFNMDRLFKRAGAHGKQSLTMAMGFGCNAAAIMSTRIIESPRERMLAILTNNFVPCNGRWPTLILLASLFMAAGYTGGMQTLVTSGVVVGMVIIGIVVTLTVSWVLSKTALKGIPTHYTLELPPYRKPKIWDTIVRATLDKSIYVLKRAVIVAAPAAILTWILANVFIGETSLLMYIVNFLDPFAKLLGLDGYILAAFILGLPANEIVVPILLMAYLSTGSLTELENLTQIKQLFLEHGWTWLTALNMMLFSLLHFPCGTTLVNIYKETKSAKWTFLSFVIPTVIAIVVTFLSAQLINWLGII
ncbi:MULTISPECIES: nucleoside recognition domain-containing protein [unclassified Bacillus (in: firmicutes)]|uniref:nucleoside recognition domain-containing protein n=1 Tax=unclassified Bacillus (in: firmicutes) TaxID=185979 RepID=UPI0008E27095|nr:MULTISPECIES: nucleoside recognition domain-containing protein [unclassified Bacillus (in: firmicutes)]SFJ89572.1 ferrous iron transport protein B [Bacillus sp. 71mf]SFT07312.1 ferrous iron transport protein B [Bacillus sp. 103mf]